MSTIRRTALSAADLFVLLDREFRRRRPRACNDCSVQLPFRVDDPVPHGANWEIVTLPRCAAACEAVLQDLVSEFQGRYELACSGT
jgi:hypothetical protein